MATGSPTEQIRELKTHIEVLNEKVRNLEQKLQDAHVIELIAKIAVLESQLLEVKKREEENDKRRWQLYLLLMGSVLTLAVQVALLFVRK